MVKKVILSYLLCPLNLLHHISSNMIFGFLRQNLEDFQVWRRMTPLPSLLLYLKSTERASERSLRLQRNFSGREIKLLRFFWNFRFWLLLTSTQVGKLEKWMWHPPELFKHKESFRAALTCFQLSVWKTLFSGLEIPFWIARFHGMLR